MRSLHGELLHGLRFQAIPPPLFSSFSNKQIHSLYSMGFYLLDNLFLGPDLVDFLLPPCLLPCFIFVVPFLINGIFPLFLKLALSFIIISPNFFKGVGLEFEIY